MEDAGIFHLILSQKKGMLYQITNTVFFPHFIHCKLQYFHTKTNTDTNQ